VHAKQTAAKLNYGEQNMSLRMLTHVMPNRSLVSLKSAMPKMSLLVGRHVCFCERMKEIHSCLVAQIGKLNFLPNLARIPSSSLKKSWPHLPQFFKKACV